GGCQSQAGLETTTVMAPVVGSANHDRDAGAATTFEKAGGRSRPFTVAAHRGQGSAWNRLRVVGDRAELDMKRSREVPGRILIVLPDVEDRPVDGLRVDELGGLDSQPGGAPVVAVAGERAGQSVVADDAGLTHHL